MQTARNVSVSLLVAGGLLLCACSAPSPTPDQVPAEDAAVDAMDSAGETAGDIDIASQAQSVKPCYRIDEASAPIQNALPADLVLPEDVDIKLSAVTAQLETIRQRYVADPANCELGEQLQVGLLQLRQMEDAAVELGRNLAAASALEAEQADLQRELAANRREQAKLCKEMKALIESGQSDDPADDRRLAADCRRHGVEINVP